ncbi:MAG: PIG-L deacetylase family protein [Bryobacteraceae bacterium]
MGATAGKSILIVAADTGWIECAGGTVAKRIGEGAGAVLVRVGNDEKESWGLSPEETALRNRNESEAAAKILGVQEVISFGYRSSELRDVPPTTIRDRLIFLIRHYRPAVLMLPNPHAEHDRNLDRYYVGAAAEDAWHCARFQNYLPASSHGGLKPHIVSEVFYYAPPVDPRRREPESTATFVPQPVRVDIAESFGRKLRAAQALRTVNRSTAMRLKQSLEAAGRRLPLLDTVDGPAIDKFVEENLRGLAAVCAEGSRFNLAEEFRYAGIEYGIPSKYLR